MALANVAALLSQAFRVLVIDWDLEAPGLERYFSNPPSVLYGSRKEKPGLVDLIVAYREGKQINWRDCLLEVSCFPTGSRISILTAGQDTHTYVDKLQQLDWASLFSSNDFGWYLEKLRRQWTEEFDFVLIDSRTGISDIGGICTVLLPDVLILMFTTNQQSMDGVLDVFKEHGEHKTHWASIAAVCWPFLFLLEMRAALNTNRHKSGERYLLTNSVSFTKTGFPKVHQHWM